jgi:hypothetical protein
MGAPVRVRARLRVIAVLSAGIALLAPAAAQPSESAGPIGRHVLQTRGIWVSFERPGSPTGWNSGELIEAIGTVAVRSEVVRQLKLMRAMGANEIVFEMRSTDGPWPVSSAYPDCRRATTLGPLWPDPTTEQLNGLRTLLDVVHAQRMRISLILNSTHMEESPPTGNARWLSAVLGAVKDKPALDLVMFGGDRRHVDAVAPFDGIPDSCGGESEAPLWLGPDSVEARYVEWAIGHARTLGIPPAKLTAEAIVGDYRQEVRQGAGPAATDGHLWPTLEVLRTIFDRLGFPEAQRTYALSYYPHAKCAFVDTSWVPCTEQEQHAWSDETLRISRERVGQAARLFLAEFGTQSSSWPREATVEILGTLLRKHRFEGAVYWQWVNPSNEPRYTHPGTDLKIRGRQAYSRSSVSSPISSASTCARSRTARSRPGRAAGGLLGRAVPRRSTSRRTRRSRCCRSADGSRSGSGRAERSPSRALRSASRRSRRTRRPRTCASAAAAPTSRSPSSRARARRLPVSSPSQSEARPRASTRSR